MRFQAIWSGAVIAESSRVVRLHGHTYFPLSDVRGAYLRETDLRTTCPEKGEATFFDVVVGVDINRHAAWRYRNPKPAARAVTDFVAFWRGVTTVECADAPLDYDEVSPHRDAVAARRAAAP